MKPTYAPVQLLARSTQILLGLLATCIKVS
jgi:hypothetical protein